MAEKENTARFGLRPWWHRTRWYHCAHNPLLCGRTVGPSARLPQTVLCGEFLVRVPCVGHRLELRDLPAFRQQGDSPRSDTVVGFSRCRLCSSSAPRVCA